MWEPEGKKKDQNFSLDRKIDLHPNPLIAELLHSAERDWKLAGEPLHWHSRAGISSCRGWRGSWAYPSVAERSPSRSNVSRENRQTAQGFAGSEALTEWWVSWKWGGFCYLVEPPLFLPRAVSRWGPTVLSWGVHTPNSQVSLQEASHGNLQEELEVRRHGRDYYNSEADYCLFFLSFLKCIKLQLSEHHCCHLKKCPQKAMPTEWLK